MDVVLIVVGVVVLALIAWAIIRSQRERRLEGKREEAGELRHTAQTHECEAQRREAVAEQRAAKAKEEAAAAQQEAERARVAQAEAQRHHEQAAEVDPDGDSATWNNGRTPERETSER